jgi:hypothetical protein
VRVARQVMARNRAGVHALVTDLVEEAMIKKKGVPGDEEFGSIPDDELEDYEDDEEADDDLFEDDEFDDDEDLDDEFDDEYEEETFDDLDDLDEDEELEEE